MTPVEVLLRLQKQGVQIRIEGDRIHTTPALEELEPDLREALQGRPAELIAFLREMLGDEPESGEPEPATIPKVSRDEPLPLSFAQQRFWFVTQLGEDASAYSYQYVLRVVGSLDVAVLQRALEAVVERHEVLRTTFHTVDGQPVQTVHEAMPVELVRADVTGEADPAAAAQRLAADDRNRAFDLGQGPLHRFLLVRTADDEHVLVVTMMHIVTDAWSYGVFFRELTALYDALHAGRPPQLDPLPIQYGDYAAWQQRELAGERRAGLVRYWRETLADLPTLELPTDRPRPAAQTFRGRRRVFALPLATIEGLQRIGREEGCTWFMTTLAAFDVLLARYSGQDDVVVGTPIANRDRSELEGLIGPFLNTLVLRGDLSGTPTFRELLQRIKRTALDAFAHQEMPFEQLVVELKPRRDLSRNPLFQVLFNVMTDVPPPAPQGLQIEVLPQDIVTSMFDLSLFLGRTGDGWSAMVEYNRDLFDDDTAARMERHLLRLLEGLGREPDRVVWELPLLDDDERQRLLVDVNETAREVPALRLVDRLAEQAQSRPEQVAVACGEEVLTYAELEARSNRLAHHLVAHGAGPGRLVGVSLERGVPMLVALLAIQKSGAAYVPLDPSYPSERIAFVIEDAGIELLVTQDRVREKLPATLPELVRLDADADAAAIAQHPATPPEPRSGPGDLAYVIFTSGSTGKPKGVQIEHRALTNFLVAMAERPGMSAQDVLLAVTTISFDIAGLELYLPLWVGGRVVIAAGGQESNGEAIMALLERHAITVMQATPATWHLLLESGWQGRASLRILCGGEALPRELAERLLPKCHELWNVYGPTETTIWSLCHRVTSGEGPVPIGTPIANTQVWVLDRHGQPVPTGVPGRLFLGGQGLARGYLRRPELTAERFVAHPFSSEPGARLYDTGDLVRFLQGGALVFQGRVDHQVKVRGFRIELGEIEHVLAQHDAVKEGVVVAQGRGADVQLAAYVVPVAGAAPDAADLKAHLRRALPDYMVPAAFEIQDALPLTPNGKIDRKALSERRAARPAGAAGQAPPRDAHEEKVAAVWREVLQVERVGRHDSFFELGGHSLLIVQLRRRLQQACGIELSIAEVFQFPTVAAMAAHVGSGGETPALTGAVERGGKQRAAMDRFKKRAQSRRTSG